MSLPASAPQPDPPAENPLPPGLAPAGEPGQLAGSRRRMLVAFAIAAGVIVIDIVTKTLVVRTIAPGHNIRLFGGAVYLTQIRNPGAAFSLATGMTWLLALIAVAVVVFVVRMATKLRSTAWAICLGLLLGGAMGNLIDRLFRSPGFLRGWVVDFVSLFGPDARYFPAFNAADSAITVGGVILVLLALTGHDFDGHGRRDGSRRAHG